MSSLGIHRLIGSNKSKQKILTLNLLLLIVSLCIIPFFALLTASATTGTLGYTGNGTSMSASDAHRIYNFTLTKNATITGYHVYTNVSAGHSDGFIFPAIYNTSGGVPSQIVWGWTNQTTAGTNYLDENDITAYAYHILTATTPMWYNVTGISCHLSAGAYYIGYRNDGLNFFYSSTTGVQSYSQGYFYLNTNASVWNSLGTSEVGSMYFDYTIDNFNITSSTDAGATISPSGITPVDQGNNQTFTYSANSGYTLNEVLVDGAAINLTANPTNYTFTNVQSSHTISVSSHIIPVVTATYDAHSYLSPNGSVTLTYGGSQLFSYSAATGYYISNVTVDGSPISLVTYPTNYTLSSVTANHTFAVVSLELTNAITASASAGVNLSPSGSVVVAYGGSQTFTFSLQGGYRINQVLVDGSPISGYLYSYTFSNVTANHTFSVTAVSSGVARIGDSLLSSIGMFAVLPIAIGAFVFIIVFKGFGRNGEDTSDAVLPAIVSAVIITVMVEIVAYISVYVVQIFTG